eukprot:6459574-Amphidinium_carterae.2
MGPVVHLFVEDSLQFVDVSSGEKCCLGVNFFVSDPARVWRVQTSAAGSVTGVSLCCEESA